MISTVNDQAVIAKRAAETEQALPHQLGCFEWFAEEIVERAAAEGIEIAGDLDDTLHGTSIINLFHLEMIEGTSECHCEFESEEGIFEED